MPIAHHQNTTVGTSEVKYSSLREISKSKEKILNHGAHRSSPVTLMITTSIPENSARERVQPSFKTSKFTTPLSTLLKDQP